jgi:hypothetical protein
MLKKPGMLVAADTFSVQLEDGRMLAVPLEWYPRLTGASATELEDRRIIGGGVGIHWPLIDEDISIAELLGGAY